MPAGGEGEEHARRWRRGIRHSRWQNIKLEGGKGSWRVICMVRSSLHFLGTLSFSGGLHAFHQMLHSAPDLSLCLKDDEDKMSRSVWKSGSGMTGNY